MLHSILKVDFTYIFKTLGFLLAVSLITLIFLINPKLTIASCYCDPPYGGNCRNGTSCQYSCEAIGSGYGQIKEFCSGGATDPGCCGEGTYCTDRTDCWCTTEVEASNFCGAGNPYAGYSNGCTVNMPGSATAGDQINFSIGGVPNNQAILGSITTSGQCSGGIVGACAPQNTCNTNADCGSPWSCNGGVCQPDGNCTGYTSAAAGTSGTCTVTANFSIPGGPSESCSAGTAISCVPTSTNTFLGLPTNPSDQTALNAYTTIGAVCPAGIPMNYQTYDTSPLSISNPNQTETICVRGRNSSSLAVKLKDTTANTTIKNNASGDSAWQTDPGGYHYSSQTGDKVSLAVTGATSFTVTTVKTNKGGIGRIWVDSQILGTFDDYSSTTKTGQVLPTTYPIPDSGAHTITIEVTGTKNTSSGGYRVYLDSLNVGGTVYDDASGSFVYTYAGYVYPISALTSGVHNIQASRAGTGAYCASTDSAPAQVSIPSTSCLPTAPDPATSLTVTDTLTNTSYSTCGVTDINYSPVPRISWTPPVSWGNTCISPNNHYCLTVTGPDSCLPANCTPLTSGTTSYSFPNCSTLTSGAIYTWRIDTSNGQLITSGSPCSFQTKSPTAYFSTFGGDVTAKTTVLNTHLPVGQFISGNR